MEAKSLIKALSCSTIATLSIGCVCETHCFILYVYLGDARKSDDGGVMTYFLPASKCVSARDSQSASRLGG